MTQQPPSTETVALEGHIVDSLTLAKVLDLILESGAEYEIVEFDMGRTTSDPSRARIRLTAAATTRWTRCSSGSRCTV